MFNYIEKFCVGCVLRTIKRPVKRAIGLHRLKACATNPFQG